MTQRGQIEPRKNHSKIMRCISNIVVLMSFGKHTHYGDKV